MLTSLFWLADRSFQRQCTARDLQPLHETGSTDLQDPVAIIDHAQVDGGGEMGFAAGRRA